MLLPKISQQIKNQQRTIADNGFGMYGEVKQRLFDPFFTTKPIGTGTGLGLSISYSIVEKHGGELSVISEPGKGAELSVSIPLNCQSNNKLRSLSKS